MFQERALKAKLGRGEGVGHASCITVRTIFVRGDLCQEQKHQPFGLFTHVLLKGASGRKSFDRDRLKMDSSYFAQRKLLIHRTANKVTTSED